MKLFDRSIRIILFFSLALFLAKFCQKETDTFTIEGVRSYRPYNPEFATRALTGEEKKEVEQALKQPYIYYGRGGQAYAFFSEDGNYVVKFFKQRLFRPPHLLNALPLPKFLHRYRYKRNWKRSDKLARDYFSYKIAFDLLQPQTGILYSHLNPTNHLHIQLPIKDRLGIVHKVDLDKFDFVLQRRAVPTYDKIHTLMKERQLEKAEEAISSIFSLISTRSQMGFRDRDPNIRTNCGFIGDKAVKIDVGRFVVCEEMKTKKRHNEEMERIVAPFREWIGENYPELISSFDKRLKEALL